eukprot:11163045-Lingulodinium_polyedra.AAC.1
MKYPTPESKDADGRVLWRMPPPPEGRAVLLDVDLPGEDRQRCQRLCTPCVWPLCHSRRH